MTAKQKSGGRTSSRKISLFHGLLVLTMATSAYGKWEISSLKNEMTGEKSVHAVSPIIGPTKRMGFPYGNVKAGLAVGCNSTSEWTYIGFNASPNLNNKDIKDGHNLIETRIKWDNNIENVTLIQNWGERFIFFGMRIR